MDRLVERSSNRHNSSKEPHERSELPTPPLQQLPVREPPVGLVPEADLFLSSDPA